MWPRWIKASQQTPQDRPFNVLVPYNKRMKENSCLEGHPLCSSNQHTIPLVAQTCANPLNNNIVACRQAVEIGVQLSRKVAHRSSLSSMIRLARKEVKRIEMLTTSKRRLWRVRVYETCTLKWNSTKNWERKPICLKVTMPRNTNEYTKFVCPESKMSQSSSTFSSCRISRHQTGAWNTFKEKIPRVWMASLFLAKMRAKESSDTPTCLNWFHSFAPRLTSSAC